MTTDTLPEPRIIPRPEHPISREHIDREALKVMHRLRDAGYVAYLVGGGVRDLYLGKAPKDFDISTNARPGELRKLFRNSRIIGRRFRLVQVFFHGGKIIEVSTFRCRDEHDLNGADKVLPSNNTFGTPAEDACRRDLTINALFYEIENFSIIDYIGGVEDLNNRLVRMVGDPERRITRDPVRMMRAIRHAARNGFRVEEKTWAVICGQAASLSACPVSRIRDELFRDLRGGASRAWAQLALASGLFFELLPFYKGVIPDAFEERQEPVVLETASASLAMLLAILGVIDQIEQKGLALPEEMLLALLLIPWAEKTMGLLDRSLKGAEAFAFSRQLRSRLDEIMLPLNVKRGTKEAITTLLVTLPLFRQHLKDQSWPKWLTRKSYFQAGLQFCQLYYAAVKNGELPSLAKLDVSMAKSKPRARKRPPRRGNRMPAFARKKGGVFGLKK